MADFQPYPLRRYEDSNNLDNNESRMLFQIFYDRTGSHTIDDADVDNTSDVRTNRPVAIHNYKLTIATNHLAVVHQYYGDDDDVTKLRNWGTEWDTPEFQAGLKKWKLAAGSTVLSPFRWETDDELEGILGDPESTMLENYVNDQMKVTTMSFKAEYVRRGKGKKGYWKNGVRPIVLSPKKQNTFGICVTNKSGSNDRSYYAVFEIKKWSFLD